VSLYKFGTLTEMMSSKILVLIAWPLTSIGRFTIKMR
jgi:hypothetical protein